MQLLANNKQAIALKDLIKYVNQVIMKENTFLDKGICRVAACQQVKVQQVYIKYEHSNMLKQ